MMGKFPKQLIHEKVNIELRNINLIDNENDFEYQIKNISKNQCLYTKNYAILNYFNIRKKLSSL